VPFLLGRGLASFLVKIANVGNPANVANAVLRQVAAFLRRRASLACFICY
jgi:hypothetical protein